MTGRLGTVLGALLGTWALPPDAPAKVALGLAVVVVVIGMSGRSPLLREGSSRRFLAIAGMVAALLSLFYVASYLRGGPRIIDASTYFLQGRALAHGDLTWAPLEPTASFRGRFLIYREGEIGGIFPPGYPLLLSLGFMIGAPMIVGPLLAAAIVVATYRLAKTLAIAAGLPDPELVARGAALLSVVCAALRYHTADTMSHGAVALGVALALDAALNQRAWIAWLAVGYLAATRPVSALPIGIIVLVLTLRQRPRALLALVPGVGLLLLAQHAVTGAWLTSTQRMYYALSDGPPGCFRWGFGASTGCVFEHGDFVQARFADRSYGLLAALGTTVRRLHHHLLDVANLEPLALLALVPLAKARVTGARAATALVGLQVLAYLPFYFDGDYPGAGARFFADVLPVEHALALVGVALLVRSASLERAVHVVLALALAGFAFHAAFEHDKLRDRDGGRPLFEPDVVTNANVKQSLVFIDSDHGFALAHDPFASIKDANVYARLRDDDRDRMVYEALDRPPTFLYRVEPTGPLLVPWAPATFGAVLRFEAEAEWPALLQEEGFAAPGWSHACASNKKAIVLTPSDGDVTAAAEIEVPVPTAATYEVTVHVSNTRIPFAKTRNEHEASGEIIIEGVHIPWSNPAACAELPVRTLPLKPPHARVRIEARGGPVGVDSFALRSLGSR